MWYQIELNKELNRMQKEFLKNMITDSRYAILKHSKSHIFSQQPYFSKIRSLLDSTNYKLQFYAPLALILYSRH